MNYREFCGYVKENIADYLPERYEGASVMVDGMMKNNGVVRQGLIVLTPDSNIAPNLYLEHFFEHYDSGASIDTVCREIAEEYQKHTAPDFLFTMEQAMDFEQAKPYITTRLLAAKANRNLMRERPSTRFDDLAVFYQIELGGMENGRASAPVTNHIFEQWGVSISELHQIAVENTERLFPSKLTTMDSVFFDTDLDLLSGGEYREDDFSMLILTNRDMIGGAVAIANPTLLHKVSDVLQDSYYIIPSSVHEVIILPREVVRRNGLSDSELGKMVRDVNSAQVSREEQVSDHVYEYDREQRMLSTVKDSKERSARGYER